MFPLRIILYLWTVATGIHPLFFSLYLLNSNPLRISSNNPSGIKATIKGFIGPHGNIMPTDGGFEIKTILSGDSAKELNRSFLSEMRRIEKRTRLRAEWTSGGITEKFFDYVPKGTRKAEA